MSRPRQARVNLLGDGTVRRRFGPVTLISDAAEVGGAERYLFVLVDELRHAVEFQAIVGDHAPDELLRRLGDLGVEITRAPGLRRRPRPDSIVGVARALSRFRASLVHINLTDPGDGLAALAGARLSGRPSVATLHLTIPNRRPVKERITRLTFRSAGHVIGVSQDVGEYLGGMRVPHSVVINGIPEPELLPDARDRLGLAPGDLVVGGVGRLHPQKGWDILCQAVHAIVAAVPEARIVVIGEGQERRRLESMPGGELVRWVGYREDAPRFIGAFDIVVVPSRYEGFGLVALEAMLAGVPVVHTAVGGLPEVAGEEAVLVEPERPDLLARAVIDLARDPDRRARMGAAGKVLAHERFSAARMASETLAVYRAMVR